MMDNGEEANEEPALQSALRTRARDVTLLSFLAASILTMVSYVIAR